MNTTTDKDIIRLLLYRFYPSTYISNTTAALNKLILIALPIYKNFEKKMFSRSKKEKKHTTFVLVTIVDIQHQIYQNGESSM